MKHVLLFIGWFLLGVSVFAQQISVEYSASSVALNESFSISIKSVDEKITSWGVFPEIKGLQKTQVSTGTQQQITMDQNGIRRTTIYTISQNYRPEKQGTYTIPDFKLEINKKEYTVKGRQITVTETRRRRSMFDFFDEQNYDFDYREMEDGAFLAVTPTKRSVYVGEGVSLSLDFYMEKSNYGLVEFQQDLGQQLHTISQKLRLPDCWVEEFNITQLQYTNERLQGKEYLKFHLGDYIVFPNAERDLQVPSVKLDMIKNKISDQTDFFGRRYKQPGNKTYKSKSFKIKIKPLPAHPLKDQVAVGRFELKESINKKNIETGDAAQYNFKIQGIGNINMVEMDKITSDDSLTFFKPSVQQDSKREGSRFFGSKTFSYNIIGEQPGVYKLSNRFFWVYFDPIAEKYDTLHSNILLNVEGVSLSVVDMDDDNLADFQDRLELADKKAVFLEKSAYTQWLINGIAISLLAVLCLVYYKRKNG